VLLVVAIAASTVADDVLLFGAFPSEDIACPAAVTAASIGAEVKNAITSIAVVLICMAQLLLLLNFVCLLSKGLSFMNKYINP
jgi:hypothetical protein